MSFCPVIEIFPNNPFYFTTVDGRVILDIDTGTTVSLSKQLKVQDDIYTVGSIDDITITIPNSPKNFFYLKELFDPATGLPTQLHLVVRITTGSETFQHDRLYGIRKTNESFEMRLVYGANWASRLKRLKIAELPLPNISFTQTVVEDVKTNNALYNDGDIGYWFPDVDYGGWREQGRIVVEDMRPFLHTLYLLQLMFKEIGWCFEFPFYETTLGRRCIDYILRDDYGDFEHLKQLRRFSARKDHAVNTVVQLGKLINWEEIEDQGNSFNQGAGEYVSVFQGKFKLNVQTTGSSTLVNLKFTMIKERVNFGINEYSVLGEWNVPLLSTPSNNTFEVDVTVTPSERVYVYMTVDELEFIIAPCIINVHFSNVVEKTFYAKGDTIILKNAVDQELSCYDFLVGSMHFCAGIVHEIPEHKTVRILTPFNANIFGEDIEGYFQNTLVNVRINQPINSTNSVVRNPDQLRYLKIAFAKTTDELNKRLAADSSELFSKTIDLGEIYEDETEEVRNPLFEYTNTRYTNHFVFQGNSTAGTPSYYLLPVMTDNNEGEVSTKIAPRKIIAYGYQKQFGAQRGLITWENQHILLLAFAAQEATGIPLGDAEEVSDLKLIYGNTVGDLWTLVLGRFYTQIRQRLQMDFLLYMTNEEFFRFNQRLKYEIEYDGHPIAGRVLSINDYQPCNIISAQLLLMPEVLAGEYCVESEEEILCANNPFIIAVFENDCWTFSIGGTFDCPIESIEWSINRESDAAGVFESLGTGSTIQLCDENGEVWFVIGANVSYTCPECPDTPISIYITPCTNSISCELRQVFNPATFTQWLAYRIIGTTTNCELTINVQGLNDGEVVLDIDSPFNQGTVSIVPYIWTLITEIENDVFYIMTATLSCDNGCPDLETTCTYQAGGAPPPQGECENNPFLICIPVTVNGITCHIFAITNSSTHQYYIVTYQCNGGESFQWMPGDDPVCCSGVITASAMVHYCNCDPVCTDLIECDTSGCQVVSAGTAIQFLACN